STLLKGATLLCSSLAGAMGQDGGEPRSFVLCVPAAAKSCSDEERSRGRVRGTAFHPLNLAAKPRAETARSCRRARAARRLCHHGWAALVLSAGTDRCVRSGLWHGP